MYGRARRGEVGGGGARERGGMVREWESTNTKIPSILSL